MTDASVVFKSSDITDSQQKSIFELDPELSSDTPRCTLYKHTPRPPISSMPTTRQQNSSL